MDSLGPEKNVPQGNFPVIADGIDDHVIKREHTDEGKEAEKTSVNNVKGGVPGGKPLIFHVFLLKQLFISDDL
jgi:hypothetical protein